MQLVALSLQGAWQSFTQGYGGYYYQGVVSGPTTGYVLKDGKLAYPDENTPEDTASRRSRWKAALPRRGRHDPRDRGRHGRWRPVL